MKIDEKKRNADALVVAQKEVEWESCLTINE
jgi:hypothetical protein